MRSTSKAAPDRSAWRRAFIRDKEDGSTRLDPAVAAKQGDAASVGSNDNALRRLITAMRSKAPGTWTDDRFEQSRHFVSTPYVAIHRLCVLFSQAEFDVRERPAKRKDKDDDLPVSSREGEELINYLEKPNWRDSFGSWMYRLCQQKWLTGTGLDWMVPNALGRPLEHYIIPTALAIPQTVMNPQYPNGFYRIQPVYPYGPFSSYPTPNSSVGAPIPAEWMLRFQFPHPLLWYDGWSPLTALRLSIDGLEMTERSQFYKMKKSINPSAVLNMDGVEGMEPLPWAEIERIRAEWENNHQGTENHGNMVVMPPGGKLEEFGRAPVEMDYTESWAQKSSFVLGGLGITKPAAGMIEDSSYSTLFATLKQVNVLTVQPECDSIASNLTRQVATKFGDNLVVKIRAKRIDDHDILFQKLDRLIDTKAITYNQLFKELDMPQVQEAWAKERIGEAEAKMAQEMNAAEANGLDIGEPKEGTKEPKLFKPADAGMKPANEEAEQERERPKPGPLSTGALGPRDQIHRSKAYVSTTGLRERETVMRKFMAHRSNGHSKNGVAKRR